MEYRHHNQPGCGGCLLLFALLLLLTGGAPALFNFLGFIFFAGLIGLFLLVGGFYAFTFYIKHRVSTYEASQTETHNRFVYLLVNVLVKIAQSDGSFTKAELNTMLNFFQYNLHYNQDQMYWVKQLIKEARETDTDMNSLLLEFRNSFNYEPRLILLELVYQLLYTNKSVSDIDLQQARNIAAFLQILARDQRTIEAKYMYGQRQEAFSSSQQEEQNYAILGLQQGDGFDAIKKAYRKLSMQYHPDKVGHLGEEFQQVAEGKMKDINNAYEFFKKNHNSN